MPAQPAWFHRVRDILRQLRTLDSDYLDRQAVEKLFGVRERRARQLIAGLPCLQIGNAVAVERLALIQRLEQASTADRFQWEVGRRTRVAEHIEQLRKYAAAQSVRVPAAPDVRDRLLRDLADGIDLQPGELRIAFTGAEDLASKLFELSQAMANDWPAFMNAVETDHG